MSTIVGIVICVSVAPDVVSGAVELVVASGVVSNVVVFEAASPETAVVVTRMPPSKGVISAVALVTTIAVNNMSYIIFLPFVLNFCHCNSFFSKYYNLFRVYE